MRLHVPVLCAMLVATANACRGERLDANALRTRGISFQESGDYARAIKDFDDAIKLDSSMGRAYASRGFAYELTGNYTQAVADFNRALELNPDLLITLKNRGRAQFFLGNFEQAAADLGAALPRDSTNTYNVIWLHLARRRFQDDAKEYAAQVAITDSVEWPAPVARFYLGKISADSLAAVAPKSTANAPDGDQRCAVAFYVGQDLLWRKRNDEARRQFEYARDHCPKRWTEYLGAVVELERLQAAKP